MTIMLHNVNHVEAFEAPSGVVKLSLYRGDEGVSTTSMAPGVTLDLYGCEAGVSDELSRFADESSKAASNCGDVSIALHDVTAIQVVELETRRRITIRYRHGIACIFINKEV